MAQETEVPTEEFETEWQNYGDVNPDPHGGRFVRWNDDHWEIVETTRADAAMAEGSPDVQIVNRVRVSPQDVWVDGEPSKGFTDHMESILESLSDEHHKQAPAGEPFIERIAYYVADMTHYLHGDNSMEEYDDYDDLIARFGVDDYE